MTREHSTAYVEGHVDGRAAAVESLKRLEKQLCPALEDPTIKQVVADAAQGLHNIATAIWGLALILMVMLAGVIVVLAL